MIRNLLAKFSLYIAIICIAVILAVNPATIRFMRLESPDWILFPWILDGYLSVAVLISLLYLVTRRGSLFLAAAGLVALFIPAMLAAELSIRYYAVAVRDSPATERFEGVHRLHPLLGWEPVPDGAGRHRSPGNFDVVYSFDARGRKRIAQHPEAGSTLHVFGDSFAFGHGARNADTALNLLAKSTWGTRNVRNYAVMGYGLEQMFLRLRENIEEIGEGDKVLFLATSGDIHRNLIMKNFVCWLYYQPGTIQVRAFPKFEHGKWTSVALENACSYVFDYLLKRSRLVFGRLYRFYLNRANRNDILFNADNILAMAAAISGRRGAEFRLVLIATPWECRAGAFDVDWTGLRVAFDSLMRYCPEKEEDLRRLSFPGDGHLSRFGNQWLASSLQKYLAEAR